MKHLPLEDHHLLRDMGHADTFKGRPTNPYKGQKPSVGPLGKLATPNTKKLRQAPAGSPANGNVAGAKKR